MIHQGKTVGSCTVTEQGLYWLLECRCALLSDRVERLYCGQQRLGVLERDGDSLYLRRRVSRAVVPELTGHMSLTPAPTERHWEGRLLGEPVSCLREGNDLLFPYEQDAPCPCEPLICFFEVRNGFWRLPLQEGWARSVGEDSPCT